MGDHSKKHSGKKPLGGLVIGRFIPPHRGHDYLLQEAFNRCAGAPLTVMIMARPDEKIPGPLRAQWLRAEHPGKNIQLVMQTLPEDYNDPAVWQQWIDLIRLNLSHAVDRVFSSEVYGEEMAQRLGVKHELIDLDRKTHKISATMVRKDFEEHKLFLAPAVYEWMKANWDISSPAPRRDGPRPS